MKNSFQMFFYDLENKFQATYSAIIEAEGVAQLEKIDQLAFIHLSSDPLYRCSIHPKNQRIFL